MSKLSNIESLIKSKDELRKSYLVALKAIERNKMIAKMKNETDLSGYDASIQRIKEEISTTEARVIALHQEQKEEQEKLIQLKSKPQSKPKKTNSNTDTLF